MSGSFVILASRGLRIGKRCLIQEYQKTQFLSRNQRNDDFLPSDLFYLATFYTQRPFLPSDLCHPAASAAAYSDQTGLSDAALELNGHTLTDP